MGATVVFVDGKKLFLNPFMTLLIGNITDAIARSLKSPEGSKIEFILHEKELRLLVDEQDIPLNLGHAQDIVGNIFAGIIKSLKGAETGSEFRFVYERSAAV